MHFRFVGFVAVALFLASLAAGAEGAGTVELELATQGRLQPLDTQQWYRLLTDLKVSGLQIRGARADDKPAVETRGTPARPVYKVTGFLTERNELLVPGARFTLRDRARLAEWLERLSAHGPGRPGEQSPFGLGDAELKRVHDDLRQPVGFSTKGQPRRDALDRIRQTLRLPIATSGEIEAALLAAGPIQEEFQGVAAGTSLAALLRPAGLGLAPERGTAGALQYRLVRLGGSEAWPIGRSAEDRRQEVLPAYFQSINVQIEKTRLAEALDAIAARLEIPVLYDHNALAYYKIDPATVEVSLPRKRFTYSLILRSLLGQATLIGELRTDEAGKPFLWVTTFRKLPAE